MEYTIETSNTTPIVLNAVRFCFCKTRAVKSPERAHFNDAGMDLFVPEFNPRFVRDFNEINADNPCYVTESGIIVPPGASVRIPMGIRVHFPDGYAMISFNKSGVASKTGLALGACVVDSGYSGEVIGNMLNTSNETRKISFEQKLFQSVIIPIYAPNIEEVDYVGWEKLQHNGGRGDGGFGSTGI